MLCSQSQSAAKCLYTDLRYGTAGLELCFALMKVKHDFSPSIWIRDGNFSFRTIQSVGEAMAFLLHFPQEGRGAVYHTTVTFIQRAAEDRLSTKEARQAFCRFADDAGILVETTTG